MGGRRHWQWSLTMITWLYEHLGIVALLRDDRKRADQLLHEGSFHAEAFRQVFPFLKWKRGEHACHPGFSVCGVGSERARFAHKVDRNRLVLPDYAYTALTKLLEEEESLAGQRVRDGGPLDPMEVDTANGCTSGAGAACGSQAATTAAVNPLPSE